MRGESSHRTARLKNSFLSRMKLVHKEESSSEGERVYPEMIYPKPIKSILFFRLCY